MKLSTTFKGEKRKDGTVIAVKTHHPKTSTFDRAILVHRDPHAAFVADANRLLTHNHIGSVKSNVFETKGRYNSSIMVIENDTILLH